MRKIKLKTIGALLRTYKIGLAEFEQIFEKINYSKYIVRRADLNYTELPLPCIMSYKDYEYWENYNDRLADYSGDAENNIEIMKNTISMIERLKNRATISHEEYRWLITVHEQFFSLGKFQNENSKLKRIKPEKLGEIIKYMTEPEPCNESKSLIFRSETKRKPKPIKSYFTPNMSVAKIIHGKASLKIVLRKG